MNNNKTTLSSIGPLTKEVAPANSRSSLQLLTRRADLHHHSAPGTDQSVSENGAWRIGAFGEDGVRREHNLSHIGFSA